MTNRRPTMLTTQQIDQARRLLNPVNLTGARSKTWYRVKNLAGNLAGATDIYIYDEIGGWGVTADDFARDLDALDTTAITLHINSRGGEVFDALAIYNLLRTHPANVTTVVDGVAASAASFIALAGDTVQMYRNSQLMIHEASIMCMGTADGIRKVADFLDMASDNIADIYEQKTGTPGAEWRAVMKAGDSWYSAAKAVEVGLADVLLDKDGNPSETDTNADETKPDEADTDADVAALIREAFTMKEAAQ